MPRTIPQRASSRVRRAGLVPPLALTLVCTFIAYVGVSQLLAPVAVPPEGVSLLWLPNAVLAVALLKTERRWWWTLWVVAVLAEITADGLQSIGPGVAAWWGVVNVLEATAVVVVLQRFSGPGTLMRSVQSVGLLVAASLVIPASTAVLGALGSAVAFDAEWSQAWKAWWFGDAIGLIIGVPIGLALFDLGSSVATTRSRPARLAFAVTILVTGAVAIVLVAIGHYESAQHVAIAGGIVAGLGLGAPGAGIGAGIAAVTGVLPAVLETGDVSVVTTQAFLLVVSAALLFIGAAIESEHGTIRALARSEARFRATFDDAPIGMAITDLTPVRFGRWTQVNLALARTLGRTPHELLDCDPAGLVHPDDRDAHPVIAIGSGPTDRLASERRYQHADGAYRWCRVVKSVVRDPLTGEPSHAVTQIEDITAAKDAAAQLEHAALHDALTGLPNRLLLTDRLARALAELERSHGVVGVMYVDLDNFKTVNDSLGHDAGDTVLLEVAQRLRSGVRPGDTVARLGGDEFVVVCGDVGDEDLVLQLADRVSEELNGPAVIDGHLLEISGSIGVAITRMATADPIDLLRAADSAMFEAKSRGRGRVVPFDERIASTTIASNTEEHLRDALFDDRLVLEYQPIVDMATDRVIAVEALLRYEQPDGTLVHPDDFLAVAEESGLIVAIGGWVVREACRQAARWEANLRRPPQVSVNISGRQLTDPDFERTVLDAIESSGVDPHLLCLEVTETVLVDAPHSFLDTLELLRHRGLGLALDDFGTGYSSMTYLKRFPVDRIKIDRSFTAGLSEHHDDRAIVAAISNLGRSLGLTVIAEGVETHAQCELLRAAGCDLAQGFLFAHPAPPEVLASVLN